MPVIATSPPPESWLDWRLGAGLVAGALAALGKDLIFEQGRRLKARWALKDEQAKTEVVRQLTREEKMQAQIDALLAEKSKVLDERNAELKAENEALKADLAESRRETLQLVVGGAEARAMFKRVASRELLKTSPGIPRNRLEHISEVVDSEEDDEILSLLTEEISDPD